MKIEAFFCPAKIFTSPLSFGEGTGVRFLLPASAFHSIIVVSLTCTAYQWGTFIEA